MTVAVFSSPRISRRLSVFAWGLATFALGIALAGAQPPLLHLPQQGKLPVPTQMHGTAVIGSRLYILGGNQAAGWSNSVYSARIGADGTVGEWRNEQPLPDYRAYLNNCVDVLNNRIYVVSGMNASGPAADEKTLARGSDILWTTVRQDGTLDSWTRSRNFPGEPRSQTALCATGKRLLMSGGRSKSGPTPNCYTSIPDAEGHPAGWTPAGDMPIPLWFHNMAYQNGRVYVWNGSPATLATVSSKVFSAPFDEEAGKLGTWREEPQLDFGVYSAAGCGINDYLVSIGGRPANSNPINEIVFHRLNQEPKAGWTRLRTNLEARVYHSLGLDRSHGWIFVTGGKNKSTPDPGSGVILDTIQAFRVEQSGESRLSVRLVDRVVDVDVTDMKSPSLLRLSSALEHAKAARMPVLVFFYSPEVPACDRVWKQMHSSGVLARLARENLLAAVDSAGADASVMYTYKIFRVPSLLQLSPAGEVLNKIIYLPEESDFSALLNSR